MADTFHVIDLTASPQIPARLVRRAENPEVPFAALEAIRHIRGILDQLEMSHIQNARTKGLAWADISEAMGITRQALQQRVKAHEARTRVADAPSVSRRGG